MLTAFDRGRTGRLISALLAVAAAGVPDVTTGVAPGATVTYTWGGR